MFLALREDGFGQRLKVILDCIRLANLTNSQYKFSWSAKKGSYGSFHACPPANEIFSENYLKTRIVKHAPAFKTISDSQIKNLSDIHLDYPICVKDHLSFLEKDFGPYRNEFDSIEFSDALSEVIKFAGSIPIPSDATAIHVRAGDICFGPLKYKSSLYQDKVYPLPIILDLIADTNKTFVIFTQDGYFVDYFSNHKNVMISSSLYGSIVKSNVEATVLDALIMSRCARIFGGSSGLIHFACMLSGSEHIPLEKYGDSKTIVHTVKNYVSTNSAELPNEVIAFLCSSLVFHAMKYGDLDTYRFAIDCAIAVDATPQFLVLSALANKKTSESIYLKHLEKWKKLTKDDCPTSVKKITAFVKDMHDQSLWSKLNSVSEFGEKEFLAEMESDITARSD